VLADSYMPRQIIVVDNASTDDSSRILDEVGIRHPEVTVLWSSSNLGYAGAVNLAMKSAEGAYVAVLNMDITVDCGWLKPLIGFLENDPSAGAVNPLVLLPDGMRINAAGLDIHVTGLGFAHWLWRSVDSIGRSPVRVSGISGAAFVIRRRLLDQIGGMDTAGFLYHEDVNLSWLLHLLGFELYCVPESVVRHDYLLSVYPTKIYLLERNRWAMLLAYLHLPTLVLLMPPLLVTEVMMWCYCILRGWAFVRAKFQSYLWLIRRRGQIWERRQFAESARAVSDWAVVKKLRWAYTWNQLLALGRERGASRRQNTRGLSRERLD
jgi:GT2 family glycosyltransferase